jgi:ribosome-binding factor A
MQGKRIDRLSQLIKEEISGLLQRELKDPRLGFVTVTAVEMSKDFRAAKVYVSVFGTEQEWRSSLEALESAKGFIRNWLRQHLTMRIIPTLSFRADRSMARAANIQSLLAGLETQEAQTKDDPDV